MNYFTRLFSLLIALVAVCPLRSQTTNPVDGYSGYTNSYFLSYSKGSFSPSGNGDVFVSINFAGTATNGATDIKHIGGVTVTNIQVDTGSRGLYVSANLVSNVITPTTNSWPGTNYLSSSKRVFIGHYIPTAVNFQVTDQNSNPTIATAYIPVLVVDTLGSFAGGSPTYSMNNSSGKVILTTGATKSYSGGKVTLSNGQAVSYSNNPHLDPNWNFGVGFGPHTNETSPSGPVGDNTNQIYNALINLTTMSQYPANGGMVPGYILETNGIQLGLTESTTNFAYTELLPSGYSDADSVPDWRLSLGEVVANGFTNGPGTILMDAGIGYSFLSTDVVYGWKRRGTNALSINLVNSGGSVGYNFTVLPGGSTDQSNNVVAPSGVTNNGSTNSLFINTGRHVFYGFNMLYDAQNGFIGVIPNNSDTNVFFTPGFYPSPGSLLLKQTILFPAVPAKNYGDPAFALKATATSGLPITYSVLSGPATVSRNILTLTGAGTITVQANQGGDPRYLGAPSVNVDIVSAQKSQAITFVAPSARVFIQGGTNTLVATAAGGPVTFTSGNSNIVTISGNIATTVAAGSSTITATQAGSTNYLPANPVKRVLTIEKASQTITFQPITPILLGQGTFSLSATASSGLPVGFISSNTNVVTVSGSSAFIVGKGTVVITATQVGNNNWKAARPVGQRFSAP